MNKNYTTILVMLCLAVGLLVTACSGPPEDVPQAEIAEETTPEEPSTEESTEEDMEEGMDDEESMMDAEEKAVNLETSSFEFEGYAPGKSHAGTFDEFEGVLHFDEEGNIVGMEGTVQAGSVNTGIEGLDTHLKADDFFDVEAFPEIHFLSSSLEEDTMTGDLTFHGITKEVSFPVTVTENEITADFSLDTTPFEMENAGVDKNVRIEFTFNV